MTNHRHDEDAMEAARSRFASSPTLTAVSAPEINPFLLEAFLINFSARGVCMTEPAEGRLKKAAGRGRLPPCWFAGRFASFWFNLIVNRSGEP